MAAKYSQGGARPSRLFGGKCSRAHDRAGPVKSPELKPLRDRAGPVLDPSRQMGNGPATAPSDLKGP